MTTTEPSLSEGRPEAPEPGRRRTPPIGAWLPTWDLITTKNLEIRKRRGLMITMVVLIVVPGHELRKPPESHVGRLLRRDRAG